MTHHEYTDPIDASEVSARCGRPVTLLATCDSTSRQIRPLLGGRGAAPVVVADHQEAGRGRLGRSWQAAPGQSLLWTMAIPLKVPVAQAPRLVLAWAAAMAQRLDLGVKWPNDLVDSQDRKLAGMLAELELRDGSAPMVLLGVGLNVHQPELPGLPGAASLSMLGRQGLRRTELLAELIGAVDAVDQGAEGLLEPWRRRSRTLGRRVRVGAVEGVARALREDGALVVGEEVVLAGDVEMVG